MFNSGIKTVQTVCFPSQVGVINTRGTIEDVRRAAVHRTLFTTTDCERQALESCLCLGGLNISVFFCTCVCTPWVSDTVHSQEPICEVGCDLSIERQGLLSYCCFLGGFLNRRFLPQECPDECAWAEIMVSFIPQIYEKWHVFKCMSVTECNVGGRADC